MVVENQDGKDSSSFEDLAKLEIEYFKGVYKDDNRVNIAKIVAKIVHMTSQIIYQNLYIINYI